MTRNADCSCLQASYQVKKADWGRVRTRRVNYVFWGGREGYHKPHNTGYMQRES